MASTPPHQEDDPKADEIVEGQAPPSPDEDGPHDVPDDKVIEKTLPTRPARDGKSPR